METFDHVIVGGGIIGASIAYHLTQKGARSVVLLERNELASAASCQGAGQVRGCHKDSCSLRFQVVAHG